jgi:hypothetical protein
VVYAIGGLVDGPGELVASEEVPAGAEVMAGAPMAERVLADFRGWGGA